VLPLLEEILRTERHFDEVFATVCDMSIAPDRRTARLRLAGHPTPLSIEPAVMPLPDDPRGPPLGIVDGGRWEPATIDLGERWSLLFYTDGLVEAGSSRRRPSGSAPTG
jgi:serine phosphatase RsbU (regulator of sigma subunit)